MILQTLLHFIWTFIGKLGSQMLTVLDVASTSYAFIHFITKHGKSIILTIFHFYHICQLPSLCLCAWYLWPSILTWKFLFKASMDAFPLLHPLIFEGVTVMVR